jgi:hypothetical protein
MKPSQNPGVPELRGSTSPTPSRIALDPPQADRGDFVETLDLRSELTTNEDKLTRRRVKAYHERVESMNGIHPFVLSLSRDLIRPHLHIESGS